MLKVVRASYERSLKRKGELSPSLDLPHKSKDIASGSRSRQKNKRVSKSTAAETPSSLESEESEVPMIRRKSCLSKAVHDILASRSTQEASLENGAPRRKLRRPTTSGHFKQVGTLLCDSDYSPKDGDVAAPSSLIGVAVEKEVVASSSPDDVLVGRLEASTVGVAKVTHDANSWHVDVDVEGQACHSPSRGNLKEVQVSMFEVSGAEKGGEDNARVGIDVDFDDEDIDVEDEVRPACGSTICEADRKYHVRVGILIVDAEAEGKTPDYALTLAHAKMDAKNKFVDEDLVRGDEYHISEFQRLIAEGNQLQCVLSQGGWLYDNRSTFTDLEDKDISGLISVRYEKMVEMLEERDVRMDELSSQLSDLKKVCSRAESEESMNHQHVVSEMRPLRRQWLSLNP
ncbi:hypothetical protein ACFE04_021681 [Oxalis oulophora]